MTKEQTPLSEESSINELFEAIQLSEAPTRVVPVSLTQNEKDTRMLIIIRGEHETASAIMAEIMSKVQELFDVQEQVIASASNDPTIERV